MTDKEFFKYAASGTLIVAGSEAHQAMHRMSQDALRLTVRINSVYHNPDELREHMSELTGKKLDESFGLFPPFCTNCGKSITISKRGFINMGSTFQDRGGITIGDGTCSGIFKNSEW